MHFLRSLIHFGTLSAAHVTALPVVAESGTASSPQSTAVDGRSLGFATTNGVKFVVDGKEDYLVGSNSYWIGFLTNSSDVDKTLDDFTASGLKVLRVWGFNDVNTIPDENTVWYQYLSASGSIINTGPNGLQRLDYVVKAAEARGVKLIIPFVNNWDDYGGMKAYTRVFGGTTFYESSGAQQQYRKYIEAVVIRYRDSPTIFAWEVANEARCTFCSTDVIYNWARDISAYIKSLDPHHMVALGDEGFGLNGDIWHPYWLVYGLDFWRNLQIPTLDFAVFHMYPSTWSVPFGFATTWIKAHAERCAMANKPCFFEEYGVPYDNNHCPSVKPWQDLSLKTPGMAGDAYWQFGTTISFGRSANDGYTIFLGTEDFTCSVAEHVKAVAMVNGSK